MKGERTVEKRRERNTKKTLLDIYSKYGIILILILIMAFLTIRTGGTFIGKNNLLNILKQIACIGVLACGQTAVIIAGGMGGGAVEIFNERNIEVIVGAEGDAKVAVEAYLRGDLRSTGSICHEHEHVGKCDE